MPHSMLHSEKKMLNALAGDNMPYQGHHLAKVRLVPSQNPNESARIIDVEPLVHGKIPV